VSLGENGDYARRSIAATQHRSVLQKRNTEFFSLEYCAPVAIIRDAMAGNKTDTYGHIKNPALKPTWLRINHLLLGEQ
jgi:hypothetical protein